MNAYTKHHFYASNIEDWATTNETKDLSDLLKYFDGRKLNYELWYVPVHSGTPYKIKQYAPQVDGAISLDYFEFEGGKKIPPNKRSEY